MNDRRALKFVKMFAYHKSYAFLVMSTLIIYTQQQENDPAFMEKFQKFSDECEQEVGIEPAVLDKAWADKHYPNNPKLKCFFKCLHMKLGVMDKNGNVIDDVLRDVAGQFVDTSTRTEIVKKCGDIQGADLCETAMKLAACFKDATVD